MKDLTALFCPKSIAVIGASRSSEKVGAVILKNIIESRFTGKIFPVNPNADIIDNLKCYPDVKNLPEVPDLALIAVPAVSALTVLEEIGGKGIKNVVVFSAGFKESGEEGKKLEQNLSDLAKKYNLNLLGPNCLGFINNLCPLNATFGEQVLGSGNLSFISQSGAIAAGLFDWCNSVGLSFNEFITLGNKTEINENDVLQYLAASRQSALSLPKQEGLSNVRPIGLYLESISDGLEFRKITTEISKTDPIIIIKPGKTEAAAKAMQSHTGAIAGADSVLQEALDEAGIIRCQTLEDFFDLSRAFAWEDAPLGPKVAIVSNAGGPAVISADAVITAGLELVEFDEQTRSLLSKILPRSASVLNPVDVLGDALAERFAKASEIILQNKDVNALIVILTPQIMTQIGQTAQTLGDLSRKYQKPIFCSFIGGGLVREGEKILNQYKIPSFHFPEQAIFAAGAMWRWKKQQSQGQPVLEPDLAISPDLAKIKQVIDKAQISGQKTLDNFQSNEILVASGIPTPATAEVSSLDQAVSFCRQFGWPVVLKLSSPGLLHKKKIGGVIADIRTEEALENAWEALQRVISHQDESIRGSIKIQVQKEVASGVEVILGVKKDPTFGWVILFGAGGSLAELISDRNLHLLPLSMGQARQLVKQSKIYPVLRGDGTVPPYALDKLYEVMVKLGKLAENLPEASDIEINPLIVTPHDVWAVDGKVILDQGEEKVITPKLKVAHVLNHQILATTYHFYDFQTEEPLSFIPGQYISIKVASERFNCYSIASHSGENQFSLLVDTKPGGPGSKFFDSLKVGNKITYLGPFGQFALKLDDGAKNLLFLATGSGCAPLRAMIESALIESQAKLNMVLYLGLSYPQDLFWQDYFQKLSQEHPNFKLKVAVWKPDGAWQGATGFITDLVKNDFPDASECSAYLCGNKNMIADASKLLLERGILKERIYTEKY